MPLPAPLFILLTAFLNDYWSRRFFVKISHLFSSYSFFLFLGEQTMVFCPLCYISNPIATTFGSFPSSQQSFHTLFGLPTFTIKPWSPLLFSLSIEKCFFTGSAAFSKRDTNMSSALFGSRAICSVAYMSTFRLVQYALTLTPAY